MIALLSAGVGCSREKLFEIARPYPTDMNVNQKKAAHFPSKKQSWNHFTASRMAAIKQNKTETPTGKDLEKWEPFCIVGGNVNGAAKMEKQYSDSSKN